ncbi:Dynamin-A [Phytophthora nicotianae]|uniref:Dynamin-A n=1 Tax=Phytophthora nicotianae TaxID=4792 RepID=A0A0W8BVL9_PHYNI|nr:Dynamin-A [Phytophthora nicotianae]
MRVSDVATGGSALSHAALLEAARRQAANEAPAQLRDAQEAEESPGEEDKQQKKTPPPPARSLAAAVLNGCVGEFYRAMEHVTNILTDEELKLPQIVVIGEESSGKSSVLENVAMLPLFPRDSDICTRMPILLKMSHGNIEGDPELMPHCKGNPHPADQQQIKMRLIYSDARAPIESERLFTLQEAAQLMSKWMKQIVQEEHDANKLAGVVDHVLEIEVRAPNLPNLKVVDLPGIVAGKLIDEPEDMMQRTRALVEKYLKMPDTLVLAVVPAFERARNSQAFQLVQQYKLADKTIGVLTMVDRALDETNPEGPLTQVKSRLDGTSSDIVYLKEGYVAVRNRNSRLVPEVSLEEFKEEEDAWLEGNLPGYIDRRLASSTVLVDKLEKMLATHIRQYWVPATQAKIKKEIEKVADKVASLGPDAQEIVDDFLRVSHELKVLANDLELYLASRGFHNTSFDEVYVPKDTSDMTPMTREMSRLIISALVPTLGKAHPRGLGQASAHNGFHFGGSFGAKQTTEESREAGEFELRLFFALTSHVVAPLLQSICGVSDLIRKMQEYVSSFPKVSACKTHIFHDTTAGKRKKLKKKMKHLDAAAEGLKALFP